MPKLRNLSGTEVLQILGQFGFTTHSQRGSHIKVGRLVDEETQTLKLDVPIIRVPSSRSRSRTV